MAKINFFSFISRTLLSQAFKFGVLVTPSIIYNNVHKFIIHHLHNCKKYEYCSFITLIWIKLLHNNYQKQICFELFRIHFLEIYDHYATAFSIDPVFCFYHFKFSWFDGEYTSPNRMKPQTWNYVNWYWSYDMRCRSWNIKIFNVENGENRPSTE